MTPVLEKIVDLSTIFFLAQKLLLNPYKKRNLGFEKG